MTQSERQLYRRIGTDPMISQEILTECVDVSLSSVEMQILTEQEYTAGKGYILSAEPYAVVVGGVNMDIGGCSYAPLVRHDSNPGKVTMSVGGVGCNIAQSMSLLGLNTYLLTALGDDIYAQRIAAVCAEQGIDISHAVQVPGIASSTYIFLNGPDGDMALAMSDMDICAQISPQYLASNLAILNSAQLILVDTNLPPQSLEYLADHCTPPIFADPVSTAKAGKLKNILGKIHTLKPNRMEAELLSGVKITDEASLRLAAQRLLETGLKRIFISLGTDGVFAADHEKSLIQPCYRALMRNATGAGDAFMAALAWAYLEGSDLADTTRAATAAAAIAVEGIETINHELSVQKIHERMVQ